MLEHDVRKSWDTRRLKRISMYVIPKSVAGLLPPFRFTVFRFPRLFHHCFILSSVPASIYHSLLEK